MFVWLKRLAATFAVALLAACGGGDDDHPRNVVQVTQEDARFSILVEAVTAADLGATLSGPGPFTVFAPTNDAFAALLGELGLSKAQLLANKPLLTAVLKYHVLAARVPSTAVPLGQPISPLEGGIFKVDQTANGLVITDGRNRTSRILSTDIAASNGVIHVIDRVLLPADKTILQTAAANPSFSILAEAVTAANLTGTLSGPGPFTVFAPTDAAFGALLTELGLTKAQLLGNTALLTKVLTYHVVPSRVLKAQVPVGAPITTVQGEAFTVNPSLAITDRRARMANITATDILTSNGVIHAIDKVILPAP
jgi:uncharacterized surface protein with fasciclin (FAS1) repeats